MNVIESSFLYGTFESIVYMSCVHLVEESLRQIDKQIDNSHNSTIHKASTHVSGSMFVTKYLTSLFSSLTPSFLYCYHLLVSSYFYCNNFLSQTFFFFHFHLVFSCHRIEVSWQKYQRKNQMEKERGIENEKTRRRKAEGK